MAIKKIQPFNKAEVETEVVEEVVSNPVPTWQPNNDPPATFEQDETHNLAKLYDVNDPTR